MHNNIKKYKEQLAKLWNGESNQVTLYQKGRVGLYGILQALGIKSGDEVIIPAFTCVVVPNAIKYLGATPVYVDISPDTYNIDINKVESAITNKTKVIIAQNTFGLSSDVKSLLNIASIYNIRVIEDCTHGLGGHCFRQPNGTLADASFYSSQWNKTYSTGLGGMVFCRNIDLAIKMVQFEARLLAPHYKTIFMLRMQYFVRKYVLSPAIYWHALKLYRWLSKKNLVTGSSQGEELQSVNIPSNYLTGISEWQSNVGLSELKQLKINLSHRLECAEIYNGKIKEIGLQAVLSTAYSQHTYIQFPILVKNRTQFFELAEREKIQLGDWFLSPIHPILNNFEVWEYNYGKFPVAEYISRHIVNLKTDRSISIEEARKTAAFLYKHRNHLLLQTTYAAAR